MLSGTWEGAETTPRRGEGLRLFAFGVWGFGAQALGINNLGRLDGFGWF